MVTKSDLLTEQFQNVLDGIKELDDVINDPLNMGEPSRARTIKKRSAIRGSQIKDNPR